MATFWRGSGARRLALQCNQHAVRSLQLKQFTRLISNMKGSPQTSNGGTLKLALIGVTLGGISGTMYSVYNNWRDKSWHKEQETIQPKVLSQLPNIKITKQYLNTNDMNPKNVILFQYQTCPFCSKVRAFLDYMGMSYSVVEVDAVLRQDLKWSGQKKVPLVLIRQSDGRYVQMSDSSAIISLLASSLHDKRTDVGEIAQFYPAVSFFDNVGSKKLDILNKYFLMYQNKTPTNLTPETQNNERKWRMWADNHLVHLISPNCYRTLGEAFETFEWFAKAGEWDEYFPKWERNLMVNVGATAMWAISKILKRRHGLSDDVRSHLYTALDKWDSEIKKHKHQFHGGDQPDLADLSVYGVLTSMEGCQAFQDCLNNTNIGEWYYSVQALVTRNRGRLVKDRLQEGNAMLLNDQKLS